MFNGIKISPQYHLPELPRLNKSKIGFNWAGGADGAGPSGIGSAPAYRFNGINFAPTGGGKIRGRVPGHSYFITSFFVGDILLYEIIRLD